MAKRTDGKTKLTAETRQRLIEMAREMRGLVYGEQRCPDWGTSFAEIESDAREVGQELIRLLMEQANADQSRILPDTALTTGSGEKALLIGTEERTIETESGPVSWQEPKAHLPKSRKAFFPSEQSPGTGH